MKTTLLALLIVCIPATATAEYEPTVVHVIYENQGLDGVTGAEFAVANLPLGCCAITEHWNSDLIIGDVVYGVSMIFDPPLDGPLCYFGYLEFVVWEPIGTDYIMSVVPSETDHLLVVDLDYVEHPVSGGSHIFNCVEYCEPWFCGGTGTVSW